MKSTQRGYNDSRPLEEECVDNYQPRTRTELLRKRTIELQSLAHKLQRVTQADKNGIVTWSGKGVNWWTLVEGYRENALEAFASSPRYQRYANKQARSRAAEHPDPYNTHEVRIKRPSKSLTDNISSSRPPPEDAEAYFSPRRTIKHFTDDFFAWKARLESRGDLDEHGKSRRFDLDEREPPYSSLVSNTTQWSLAPKGGQCHCAHEIEEIHRVLHPPGRSSASEVARRALDQRHARRDALEAVIKVGEIDSKDNTVSSNTTARGKRTRSSSANSGTRASNHKIGPEIDDVTRRHVFPVRHESNRRRYSRLCGQS